ncbi:XrtA/PEP-CTERM system TPR-repeat protein PrsT [Photobacterium lutimaris]|nr:XrtA/PEP-CTERM system TPR-repeat protein PrsT [Photobacterium lutimaris]TDR78618.1 putative PEP-CTERM system TPR-repeat lipoprotein [Photobacterium lutimaris]
MSRKVLMSVFMLLLSINLLACSDVSPEAHLLNAKNNLEHNDLNSAVIELKNAIKKDKRAIEPRIMLGEIYLLRGEYPAAEKEFSTALKSDSNNNKTKILLAQALLGQDDILAIEELALRNNTHQLKFKSELLSIYAIALMRNNEQNKASSILEETKELGFKGHYFNLSQAQFFAYREEFQRSIEILKRMLVSQPENVDVLLLTAMVLTAQSDHVQAITIYQKVLATSEGNPKYKLLLAQSLVKNEQYSDAEPYIDDILNIAPSNRLAHDLKALVEYSQSDYNNARKHAKIAIREGSNSTSTLVIAGVTAYMQNDYEDTYETLKNIIPYLHDDLFLQKIFVAAQFKIGEINEALDKINSFDLSNKDYNDFATKMSLEYSFIGRNNDAMALAEKAEANSTTMSQLRIGLLRTANNDQKGISQLENILKIKPDQLEANVSLAYYHLSNGDIEKGEDIIDKWLISNENDITAILLKGYLSIKKEKYGIAKSMFNKALDLDPSNVKAKLSLLQIEALAGNSKKSFDETLLLAKQHPDNFAIAMFLYRFASQTDQVDKIINFYSDLLSKDQNNTKLRMLLVRIYSSTQQQDKGIALLEELPSIEENANTLSLETLLYFQIHDYRNAFLAAEKWIKLDRTNPEAYLRLVQLSELTKNFDKGIKYALEAEKIFIEHSYFPLMRATLLLLNQQPILSQAVLDELPENIKKTSYFLQLQSKVSYSNKDYAKSVSFAQKRYDSLPNSITAKDLVSAYVANDQYTDAINLLKRRINDNPESEGALALFLAQIQNTVEPDEALRTYLSILEKEPNNIIALNNAAWIYFSNRDFNNACDFAMRAYNNAPDAPEIQDTYGYCLLKSGQHEESMTPLKMAYEGRTNNIDISFHYAESLILNSKLVKAERILNSLKPVEKEHIEQKNHLYQKIKGR